MLPLMKRIWRAWKGLAHRIITAQNYVLMAIVYWVALAPVALVLKLVRHEVVPAAPEQDPEGSFWQQRRVPPLDMDRASRMY
ncbi:MAG: hypothetical protein H6739_34275 [Alphaproteobacteria bacterium]|nr:hypothetical protein [Alphaproteobacteria bacterium]